MMCCPACDVEWGGPSVRCPDCGRPGRYGLIPYSGYATNDYPQPPRTHLRPLTAQEREAIRDQNPTLEVIR